MPIGQDLDVKLGTHDSQIAALTAAVAVLQNASTVPPPPPPAPNHPPVWQVVPTVTFFPGKPAAFPLSGLVVDPDGDLLTLSLVSGILPVGVTFDAVGKQFVWDGVGAPGGTGTVIINANDGKP
jgi:hypothetical protein